MIPSQRIRAMKDIEIYTTPTCGFCHAAKRLLTTKGVAFREISVAGDPGLRQEMMTRSGRHTVPQIFIGGVHVGGCDDLYALERSGKLDPMLAA
jgi:glutaredoxin 3